MPYHVFVKPDGYADILSFNPGLDTLPGYKYLGEFETRPNFDSKRYVDGKWVWGGSEPEYTYKREKAYPRTGELLDALWHAMDTGVLPKVEGFYDTIKVVKDRFPK